MLLKLSLKAISKGRKADFYEFANVTLLSSHFENIEYNYCPYMLKFIYMPSK